VPKTRQLPARSITSRMTRSVRFVSLMGYMIHDTGMARKGLDGSCLEPLLGVPDLSGAISPAECPR